MPETLLTAVSLAVGDTKVYAIVRTQDRNEGLLPLPVAGTVPTSASESDHMICTQQCRIVRLHSPIETMVVEWTAVKEANAPVIPDPRAFWYNSNVVLLNRRIGVITPQRAVSGTVYEFTISGVYTYALKRPEVIAPSLHPGCSPWDGILPSRTHIFGAQEIPGRNVYAKIANGTSDRVGAVVDHETF